MTEITEDKVTVPMYGPCERAGRTSVLLGFYRKMRIEGYLVSNDNQRNEVQASKEEIFCGHGERLVVTFGLIDTTPGMPIWVTKNLYMCQSCQNHQVHLQGCPKTDNC